jgi:hypothetical protein
MARRKQVALPGLESREVKDLHDKALEYSSARDERMEILQTEIKLKGELLELMKQHKRDTYECEGVEISIVHGEDTIKVRVHKASDNDGDEPEEE